MASRRKSALSLADKLHLGVQVGTDLPGVTPTGFLVLIEVTDDAGVQHFVEITSDGATLERVTKWRDRLTKQDARS